MAAVKKETGRPKDKNGKPMYSGFDAPVIGQMLPKGTTFKTNPDGTITPVLPKGPDAGAKKAKKPAAKRK